MRTVTTTLYTFDELSEDAQERAIEDYRSQVEFGWSDEYRDSLRAIESEFGLTVTRWSVDTWNYDFDCKVTNENIRGRKLKDYPRDMMPTGFGADCDFYQELHDYWKRTGDARGAVESALRAFFRGWRDDWASIFESDYIRDELIDLEFEFTEDGSRA